MQNKSALLITAGVLVILLAVTNMIVDVPGLIRDRQFMRSLESSTAIPADAPTAGPAQLKTATAGPGAPQTATADAGEPLLEVAPINGYVPDRIVIPAIHLDAPVIISRKTNLEIRDQWFQQWNAPDLYAAGWQADSAPLGVPGNTVISGHHNAYGKVFAHLAEILKGDAIYLYSGEEAFRYEVVEIVLRKEKDVSLEYRRENAAWIAPKPDEVLTLVTCWPKRDNSHRLIVVARPVPEPGS